MLAALVLPAWAQVGDAPMPRALVRPMAPRSVTFAAASIPNVTRLPAEAREERRFLQDAAAQSRFELDASRLALARSGNGALRALAASLINHHNTIGLELAHLLDARGMAMPMIGNRQRKTLNRLAKLTGRRFDALYLRRVGLGQAAVARDYERASAAIDDPQLNAWILKTLATMRSDQDMAERAMPANARLAKRGRISAPRTP
jgi:predicted outer membrane protein